MDREPAATMINDASFQAFLPRFEAAISGFINGDPMQWKQLVSRSNDVMIMGAWGAYEKGWAEVETRYDWAAARFVASGAQVSIEYLSSAVSGDLAYTVAIERSTVRVVGQETPVPMALRASHVFRREDGEWALLLRHADPLIAKTAPDTVLAKRLD
jgi:ketosteroid isomerase-like protein